MTLLGHEAPVLTCLFNFSSTRLASSDEKGNIFIWEIPSGKLLRKIKAHNNIVQDLSFKYDDEKIIVSASLDGKAKMWNSETGVNLMTFDVGVDIWSIDLVSDASIIILGCADGTIRFLTKE
jgi:WD40 repeat protein